MIGRLRKSDSDDPGTSFWQVDGFSRRSVWSSCAKKPGAWWYIYMSTLHLLTMYVFYVPVWIELLFYTIFKCHYWFNCSFFQAGNCTLCFILLCALVCFGSFVLFVLTPFYFYLGRAASSAQMKNRLRAKSGVFARPAVCFIYLPCPFFDKPNAKLNPRPLDVKIGPCACHANVTWQTRTYLLLFIGSPNLPLEVCVGLLQPPHADI